MKELKRKICILGDISVGKTSLIRRFVEGRFDDEYLSTIGVKISRKEVELSDQKVKLMVWDLAGGSDYQRQMPIYLRGSSGVFLVCDVTRRQSFRAIDMYLRQIDALGNDPKIVLLGNKIDLADEVEISEEKLSNKANSLDVPWFHTSAKTGEGVEDAFLKIAQLCV